MVMTGTSSADPGQRIDVAVVQNVRDLGGWPTTSGHRVRSGLVYRSAQLDKLDPVSPTVHALGLRTIYDLRTHGEREAVPDIVPAGVDHVALDVLADSADVAPAALLTIVTDPKAAEKELGGGRAEEIFAGAYRDIVSLPSALASYRRLFGDLAEAERLPALFHCTTGKDRTGWAAAALLLVVGVGEDDVRREYLLTNDELLPALTPILDGFAAKGGDPDLLLPVLGVRSSYLDAALEEVRTRFGSIDGYFADGLGLGMDVTERLRERLTEPPRPKSNGRH